MIIIYGEYSIDEEMVFHEEEYFAKNFMKSIIKKFPQFDRVLELDKQGVHYIENDVKYKLFNIASVHPDYDFPTVLFPDGLRLKLMREYGENWLFQCVLRYGVEQTLEHYSEYFKG
jgi:hypothetical protein